MKFFSAKILVPGLLLLTWLVYYLIYKDIVQAYYLFPVAVALFYLFSRQDPSPPLFGLVLVWLVCVVDAAGNSYDLYQAFSWFDSLTHFLGAFCGALLLIPWLPRLLPNSPPWKIGFAAMLIAIAAGSLYEVGELWVQNIGHIRVIWGEEDTSQDLQWNALGAFAAFLFWEVYVRYKVRIPMRLRPNNKTASAAPRAKPGG